jgi:hypothetical protein
MISPRVNRYVTPIFVGCVALVYLLPFIIFRENSYITVFDYLDHRMAWFKMFHDDNLFFKFNVPTRQFDGLSTLYYGHVNYSVEVLLYAVFDAFTAYIINHSLAFVLGFVSMFLLLSRRFGISVNISLLTAVCYAAASTTYEIAVESLPLIIFIFLGMTEAKKFDWKTVFLLIYPFFSSLTYILWFVLGLWFVLAILVFARDKRPNYNLIVGFVALLLGAVIVDIKLLYFVLFVKEPLLRGLTRVPGFVASSFKYWIEKVLVHGYNDTATAQGKIILPLAVFGSIYILFSVVISFKNKRYKKIDYEKVRWIIKAKRIVTLQGIILVIVLLTALDFSGKLNGFLRKYLLFFANSGFVWGRIYVLNRVMWYLLFAFYMDFFITENVEPLGISEVNYKDGLKHSSFNRGHIIKAVKLACFLLVFRQIGFELTYHCGFNDVYPTIYKNLEKSSRIFSFILPKFDDSFQPVSFKEFYSVNLFDRIKEDMDYQNENVAALGYHAAVLVYNGFNTIDGYSNMVPLEYFYRFRKIIEPDFGDNEYDRNKFDAAEGKLYLFNKDLKWEKPEGYAHYKPIVLNINREALANDFRCKYILSAAEILNAKELGLFFIKNYKDDESIYNIYLYKVIP